MEHLYVVTYDIRDPKRWRRVYRLMQGYGEWLQLSVFQCRLDRMRLVEMETRLAELIVQEEDHIVILDLGPWDGVKVRVRSLGKTFKPVERQAIVI